MLHGAINFMGGVVPVDFENVLVFGEEGKVEYCFSLDCRLRISC